MKPRTLTFYQHKHGGIYQVDVPSAVSTVDEREYVVYSHVWPFDMKTYIRPIEEWTDGRFRELVPNEVKELFARDKEEFQREILASKNSNR